MTSASVKRVLGRPAISLLMLVSISTSVFLAEDYVHILALLVIASLLLCLSMSSARNALRSLAYITSFVAIYVSMAGLMQALALGHLDVGLLLLNSAKLMTLASASLFFINAVNIASLALAFGRISAELALILVLSVKMVKSFTYNWRLLSRLYWANMCSGRGSRFSCRLKAFTTALNGFISTSLYTALQTAEALATRPKLFYLDKKLESPVGNRE